MTSPDVAAQRQFNARRQHARRCAVQALYQWHVTGADIQDINDQFHTEHDMSRADDEYFLQLLKGVATNVTALDEKIEPLLSRPLDQIDWVERAVLRIAVYELEYCLEVPSQVVVAEAVASAKKFGSDKSHKFINGVVDRYAREHAMRAREMK